MPTPHQNRHTKIILITLAAFFLSSWLTAKGLFEKAIEAGVADIFGITTAAMSAIVAAALIGGGTIMLMGLAVNASKKQVWPIVILAITLMPFIFGISTFYAALANAGGPSLVYDMRDKVKEYSEWFEASSKDSEQAQSARDTLIPLKASICGSAEGEKRSGRLTGSAGSGTVYAAYNSSCDTIQSILHTLENTAQETDERREQATEFLSELIAISKNTKLSVFERQDAFRAKTLELRKIVAKSKAEKVTKRLSGQLKNMESTVAALGIQEGNFGKRQLNAVQNLKVMMGEVSKTVSDLLEDEQAVSVEPPGELLEMGAAVLFYWKRNIPQILLAVLLDLMNLWFLGLLLVSRNATFPRSSKNKKQKR